MALFVGKVGLDFNSTDIDELASAYAELNAKLICVLALTEMSVNSTFEDNLPAVKVNHVHTARLCYATFTARPKSVTNQQRSSHGYDIISHDTPGKGGTTCASRNFCIRDTA